jgi:hypothetical protein
MDKIWWVIGVNQYYPWGGLSDVKSTHETEEQAQTAAEAIKSEWTFVEVVNIRERGLL